MKMKNYAKLLSMAAFATLTLASCSNNDDTSSVNNQFTFSPAKTPDFRAYSHGIDIGGTTRSAGTRADMQVNVNYYKIQDFGGGKSDWMHTSAPVLYEYFDYAPTKTDRDEQVSQAEYEYVINYIKDHPDEGGTTCDLRTYFIQNVGSSNDSYHVDFMNGDAVQHSADIIGGNQMDYLEINGIHVNDYNSHWGPRALVFDVPLLNPRYHDSWGTQDQTKENAYKFYYIEYEGKTNCYLCFDYRVKKYDNGQLDFQGDGVYNDWVIKISPADGSDAVDPAAAGAGSGSGEGSGAVAGNNGEIEVNLSINAEKEDDDYIATKLSIHVRDTSDIEVFIPVPAEYYCAADDMDIVVSHRLQIEQHSPSAESMTYTINGHDITLKVAFEMGGIRVTSEGVNAEVLRYLRSTYYDGITFEVWNYYKQNTTRTALQALLDQSIITFTDDPGKYINAFAKVNGSKNPLDCVVTPPSTFPNSETNDGTQNYNVIYTH